jgi:hypothetical protein
MAIIENISRAKVVEKLDSTPDLEKEKLITDLIYEYLRRKKENYVSLAYESFGEKDIKIVDDFLYGRKVDMKKYNKLALKVAEKWEKTVYDLPIATKGISDWLVANSKTYNSPFYENLKKFLFDFHPTATTDSYISEIGRDKESGDTYYEDGNIEKAIKEYDIPPKSVLICAFNNYNYYIENGGHEPNFKEYIKIVDDAIKNDFELVTEIVDITNINGKMNLINLLFKHDNKKTIDFVMTDFIENNSGTKLLEFTFDFLDDYYNSLNDNSDFEKSVIKLLESKKAGAREIAVKFIIKWNKPDTKKLLKPFLNDKNKNIVNMIADYLAR